MQSMEAQTSSSPPVPKLVVFDLDYTLWDPEMYLCDGPPFRCDKKTGKVYDSRGTQIRLFEGAIKSIRELRSNPKFANTRIAWCSRTCYEPWARACLGLITIDGVSLADIAAIDQIYPGDKRTHFRHFQKALNIDFEDMLFFDNERRNCISVATLGVVCIFTPDGMTYEAFEEGLLNVAERNMGEEKARSR